jgi:hypothetical protein
LRELEDLAAAASLHDSDRAACTVTTDAHLQKLLADTRAEEQEQMRAREMRWERKLLEAEEQVAGIVH